MKKQIRYPTPRRTMTKFSHSDYYLVLQLYKIYKAENRKEARLPLNDFRRPLQKRKSIITSLNNQVIYYFSAIKESVKKIGLTVSTKTFLLPKIKTYFN